MKKKYMFLLMFALLVSSSAYASVGVQEDGSQEGIATDINFSTNISHSNNGSVSTVAIDDSPSFAGNPTFGDATTDITTNTGVLNTRVLYATYYVRVPYYTTLTYPGSGAPVGSIMLNGGGANQCGGATAGTSITVCVSNGSNWVMV